MILSGWGRYPSADCKTHICRGTDDIMRTLQGRGSVIARGNGRAYGDAAINPDTTLLMGGCDRFIEFDALTGIIECEAGTLLSDVLDLVVPKGWFPPVVPGTKFVTVGGLVAADVHGKNHHLEGSFGRHVESFRLATADGAVLNCSRSENAEIFAATLGGMGLTGIVLSARFRLRPVNSSLINETVIRADSLDDLLHLFEKHTTAAYSVAWVDSLAKGSGFGRGLLMLGEHVAETGADREHRERTRAPWLSVPIELPISPLTRWNIKLFNELYYRLQKPRTHRVRYENFFFPLDAIQHWNRIYGRRGFLQYQCVLGGDDAAAALRQLLKSADEIGARSFLTVLKKLGSKARFLSFPMEGYTITLDFPVTRTLLRDLGRLDRILEDHKGRIYLAKDARAPRSLVEQGYPEIDAFRQLRGLVDPTRRFRSLLSERLAI